MLTVLFPFVYRPDAATETVPPRWPPSLHGHGTEGLVYELREVPLASIALVTKYLQKVRVGLQSPSRKAHAPVRVLVLVPSQSKLISLTLIRPHATKQVDLPRIMDHRISAMQGAVDALVPVIVEMQTNEKGTDALPEVDWSKLRKLEFQEALRSRRGHETKLVQQHCVETDGFEEDVSLLSLHFRFRASSLFSRTTRRVPSVVPAHVTTVPHHARAQGSPTSNLVSSPGALRPKPRASARLRAAYRSSQSAPIHRSRQRKCVTQRPGSVRDQFGE